MPLETVASWRTLGDKIVKWREAKETYARDNSGENWRRLQETTAEHDHYKEFLIKADRVL